MKNYALLLKKIEGQNGLTYYQVVDIQSGTYNKNNITFITDEGTTINHLINGEDDYSFAMCDHFNEPMNLNKYIPEAIKKKMVVNVFKKKLFVLYNMSKSDDKVLPNMATLCGNTVSTVYDPAVVDYYEKYYPNEQKVINRLKKRGNYIDNKIEFDTKKVIEDMTKVIPEEEAKIKILASEIWKSVNGLVTSKNILIGKEKDSTTKNIFANIDKYTNVPVFKLCLTENIINAESIYDTLNYALTYLLETAEGDLYKASNGIVVIDGIDNASFKYNYNRENILNIQFELKQLLEGHTYEVYYNNKKYSFDTSNLTVICLINNENDYKDTVIGGIGVNNKQEFNYSNYFDSMYITGFYNLFNKTIIFNNKVKNNSDDVNDIFDTSFLAKMGIKLTINDNTDSELINKVLEDAYQEIALDPNNYKELIINSKVNNDTKKFTLVKKM